MEISALDQKLDRVLGDRTAKSFARAFGIRTVNDLLTTYPRRYAAKGELTSIAHLPLGEPVTIVAEVVNVVQRSMRARRGKIVEITITDGKGVLTLTFFNQEWRANEIKPGQRGVFAGKISVYRGNYQLAHPDYELFDEASDLNDPEIAKKWAELPVPIYPATATIPSWKVKKAVEVALDSIGPVADVIPQPLREQHGLLDRERALKLIHRPQTKGDYREARRTLKFEEAFVLQTALARQRQLQSQQAAVRRLPKPGGLLSLFDERLPFDLTEGQVAVGQEIERDLATDHPMNRLLQGEVGSGKTLVALRAMLIAAEAGGQSALLAPTEVLATQHYRSIVTLLGPELSARINPVLITGGQAAGQRKKQALSVAAGQSRIVIGTHALLSDSTMFYDLGLVVIDEQHRFGVHQRELLKAKANTEPHVLMLTATPIPRTVAMTVFGDLDLSSLRELPGGRQPIDSFVVPLAEKPGWMARVWQRLAEEVAKGRQGYVVCGLIEDTEVTGQTAEDADAAGAEKRELASIEATVRMINQHPSTAHLTVAALHGRMKSDEKNEIMARYAAGESDVLVATTVIEVGVNVPNASIMVVLDADRFGVSQLHQLRGRIGRGQYASLALFVTSAEEGTTARKRVEAVASSMDGFYLAEVDLELRREGDVLGSDQSGRLSSLRLLRVSKDGALIAQVKQDVEEIMAADPELEHHPGLAAEIQRTLTEDQEQYLTNS